MGRRILLPILPWINEVIDMHVVLADIQTVDHKSTTIDNRSCNDGMVGVVRKSAYWTYVSLVLLTSFGLGLHRHIPVPSNIAGLRSSRAWYLYQSESIFHI